MHNIIIILVALLAIITFFYMLWQFRRESGDGRPWSLLTYFRLVFTGVVAFIADTVGIGSFAVEVALLKLWRQVNDKELPGVINGAQILPGAIESIFFLQIVHVDPLTLCVLVVGACIGGVIGGMTISRLDQGKIQITMGLAFVVMALVILANQLNLLPIAGVDNALRGVYLYLGFFGMIVCGFLPALGVGLFAVVEILLFLLGLSPLIAFPIMTTAGALQQPMTTLTFAINKAIAYKPMFIISLAGVLGVFMAMPLVTQLPLHMLRWLLFVIIGYNGVMMFRSYFRRR